MILDRYSKVWNRTHYGGLFHSQVMYWFFIYPHKILDNESLPRINSPGPFIVDLPTVNKQNQRLVPKTLSIFPRSIFPLKNFTLPDGLTTRWHVDCSVTCDGNLERIDAENICPWQKCQHVYTETDGFLTRFREHMVPSTWRRYGRIENFQSQSLQKRNKETD